MLSCVRWIGSCHTLLLRAAGADGRTHVDPPWPRWGLILKPPHCDDSSFLPAQPGYQRPEVYAPLHSYMAHENQLVAVKLQTNHKEMVRHIFIYWRTESIL